jgi:hypothetical protein
MNNSERPEAAGERERTKEGDRKPRSAYGWEEGYPPEPSPPASRVRPNMSDWVGWRTFTNGAGI